MSERRDTSLKPLFTNVSFFLWEENALFRLINLQHWYLLRSLEIFVSAALNLFIWFH